MRPPRPFPEYKGWLHDPAGAKVLAIGNLKGGVGKTTLAVNLAAYASQTKRKRVLLVDLDFQGSLSSTMLNAIESEHAESRAQDLFAIDADLVALTKAYTHLVPQLTQGWLVPANYDFTQIENRLLLSWLLREDEVDVRWRLAHSLLREDVRQRFDLIIFDLPPRMTLGTLNAIVASHYFVVPTTFDRTSTEAIPRFVSMMKEIKGELGLGIEFAGIAGVMTKSLELTKTEELGRERARDAGEVWTAGTDFVFNNFIPRRAAIAAASGTRIAYFDKDSEVAPLTRVFDPVFDEIWSRIGVN